MFDNSKLGFLIGNNGCHAYLIFIVVSVTIYAEFGIWFPVMETGDP